MDKSYQSYSLEELTSDADFREWVLNPTPENNAFWEDFIQKHPEKSSLIQEAKNLIQGVYTYFGEEKTDSEKLRESFEKISQIADAKRTTKTTPVFNLAFLNRRMSIAASIILLLGFMGGFWLYQQNSYQRFATDYGEWKTVSLPDGSTVQLNAASELTFAKNWEEGENRKVWLKGEAFFDVEKKPVSGAKFSVITEDVLIEVLGTSFNVNNRAKKTEVFLQEGKIRLEAGENETLMVPGDLIAYSASAKKIIENRKGVNEIHSSWKDGVLILKEKSVEEIFNKIEEIYGIPYQVEDRTILELKTTVRIPMDKLEIAIPILEKTLNVTIQQMENKLVIK